MSATTSSDATVSALFEPVTFGRIELANRIVMAPLTRMRAGEAGIPGELIAEHYRQRAGVGMITTEGTYPSADSQSYVGQPGITTDEQAEGWRRVAEGVHAAGGRIVMQLMHGGRTSHPDLNGGRRVVGPSAVAIDGEVHTSKGKQAYVVPGEMTTDEIAASVADHVAAARRAVDAGLDGVEIHSANGYLLHQFLAPGSNRRTDAYGGSPAARARFVVEVVTAVAAEVGADRVGLRISPEHNIQDAFEPDHDDVLATYGTLLDQVRPLGLAYLSVLHHEPAGELVAELQRRFGGRLVVNSGFSTVTSVAEAAQILQAPFVDAVAVGRAVIANPDLVVRWKHGHPQNELRAELLYAPGPEGYTDYPVHA
ncbi:alkene reductase [Kineosporia sp. J2-2]|uniref:Alkene reductase n=1 Tax=Kineosporia corallincola TaxID=2835133 RepID=A0ABS5THG8_9ACTN|nr:alkene reductase [Kineosporia corallincola]MBT0769044.1 alkene reductase [Kineosporia corallincola]